jgi:hypothetical protein
VHQFRPRIADHEVSNSLCVFHILFYGRSREQREEKIFHALLKLCFGLEERLLNASPEEVELVADLVSVVNYDSYLILAYTPSDPEGSK